MNGIKINMKIETVDDIDYCGDCGAQVENKVLYFHFRKR